MASHKGCGSKDRETSAAGKILRVPRDDSLGAIILCLVNEGPIFGVDGIPRKKAVDDEDVAIEQNHSDRPWQTVPFHASS